MVTGGGASKEMPPPGVAGGAVMCVSSGVEDDEEEEDEEDPLVLTGVDVLSFLGVEWAEGGLGGGGVLGPRIGEISFRLSLRSSREVDLGRCGGVLWRLSPLRS